MVTLHLTRCCFQLIFVVNVDRYNERVHKNLEKIQLFYFLLIS